jgi:apolipoprotein N-acyltransferase
VRAANTGISAFISNKGAVLDRVHEKNGQDLFIMGKSTFALPLASKETLYRKGGFLFPYAALALFGLLFIINSLRVAPREK